MISIGAASFRFLATAEMTRYYTTILTSPAIWVLIYSIWSRSKSAWILCELVYWRD